MKKRFYWQAKLLKAYREGVGLSQTELAKKLMVKPQFICNIERGAAGIPPKYIFKIARELGVKSSVIARHMVLDYSKYLEANVLKEIKNGRSKTNKK